MLNKLRGPHAKRILWVLAIVIIVAFSLSGAISYLGNRDKRTIGEIGGKKITVPKLRQAIGLAQIQVFLSGDNSPKKLTPLDFEQIALDFLALLWKAEQEKITVNNKEVKDYIVTNLFGRRKFDPQSYNNLIEAISRRYNLGLTARSFEEYIRLLIKIDKLFQKHTEVEAKSEETRELYLRDNQKAKIAYLVVPYEKFKVELGVAPSDIEDFYEKNKSIFEQEAKVNIAYVLIKKDNPKITDILENLSKTKTLEELAQEFSLELKQTGFIGLSDPIEEIGWQYQITQTAFSLEKGVLSSPLETEKEILVIEKLDQRSAFIPPLSEIEAKVRDQLILERAKKEAKGFSQELLDKITNQDIKDLEKVARAEKIEYKETDFFKFYDYIEGLGIDPEISTAVFALAKNEVEPNLFMREKGVYIVQLKQLSEIDEEDFEEKKANYRNLIIQTKQLSKRLKFLQRIKQEANLSFNSVR